MAADPRSPVAWTSKPAAEINAIADRPGSVAVLPVGSVEQHGPHLPVATDTILVEETALEAARRVDPDVPIIVLPTVWTGYSPHHLSFGGTLTVEFETLKHVLEDVSASALDLGFDSLLLVNGHGGNTSIVSGVTSTIGVDHPDAEVLSLTYFALARYWIDDYRQSDTGGMAHGGEFETALMLHLHPELVEMELAEATYLNEPYDLGFDDLMAGGPLAVYRGFDAYTETGAIGDPTAANESTGAAVFDRLGDELATLLRSIHERNR